MAGGVEPEAALSHPKTGPQMSGTLPHHRSDITGGLLSPASRVVSHNSMA